MKLQETLTKENFWNRMMEQYPNATKKFCDWIDEYKEAVGWSLLFRPMPGATNRPEPHHDPFFNLGLAERQAAWDKKYCPKYHDLPHAMQQGIWIEFIRQVLPEYFEQVERHMSELFDFEEDVREVFAAMEPLTA